MNRLDYILATANLPFTLGSLDPEADLLFEAAGKAPGRLLYNLSCATGHAFEVEAGDAVAAWIETNWRHVLPDIAARFPTPAANNL